MHPKDFDKLYIDVPLTRQELSEIYTPDTPIKRHGVLPDFLIKNTKTGKTIYVELKRQDGWVEGKNDRQGAVMPTNVFVNILLPGY